MHRVTSVLLAVVLVVATVATAWASASAPGAPGAAVIASAEAHVHAAPEALAVHHGHPDCPGAEDCGAMALGCAGLPAHAASEAAFPGPTARGRRAAPRDLTVLGTPPGRLERPPRS